MSIKLLNRLGMGREVRAFSVRFSTADGCPLRSALRSLLLAFCLPFVATAQEVESSAEPPELIQLRAQYEQRKSMALKPIREQYCRQLEGLLRRYIQLGLAKEALAIQRNSDALQRGENLSEETDDDPVDLKAVRNQYAVQSSNALRAVRDWYRFQLRSLHRRYLVSGDLDSAAAVEREIKKIEEDAPLSSSKFDWAREKKSASYRYEETFFS